MTRFLRKYQIRSQKRFITNLILFWLWKFEVGERVVLFVKMDNFAEYAKSLERLSKN